MLRKVTWFASPEEADREIDEHPPPNMVDILNFGGSEPFEEIFSRRVRGELDGIELDFPSKEDLIAMKRAAGRKQDLADIEALEKGR